MSPVILGLVSAVSTIAGYYMKSEADKEKVRAESENDAAGLKQTLRFKS